ncbi:MAG: alpha/beta hydrolase [Anaerolineae bacterium]|jgi:pimeloyl-ACP methyl ester carboxylesterase
MNKVDIVFAAVIALLLVAAMAMTCSGAWPEETAPPQPTSNTPASASEPADAPRFEPGPCQVQVPSTYQVACGMLIVPEDRSRPGGATLRLPVAVFHSPNPDAAPDPVIHLVGGPGGDLLGAAGFYLGAGGDDILAHRDYILFNQRGTHGAEPALECPGMAEFTRALGQEPLAWPARQARELEFLLGCQETLVARGANLAAYNSAENAADVADLRLALGYEQVNLYGISYGTRLALTVMRDHPQGVRSVILDSVYLPQVDLDETLAANAHRAFQTLFEGCASDVYCRSHYPDLEAVFYRTVDALNTEPVKVQVQGSTVDAWLDGDILMSAVFGTLYRTDAIPWLPTMIYQASQGNYEPLRTPLEAMLDAGGISTGMHYALQCREEVAFESYHETVDLAADLPPQVAAHYASSQVFDLCAAWGAGAAPPVENEPVASSIPTLVVSGQYDPITPPDWGRLAAGTLDHSFFFEFPGVGHGVIRSSDCGRQIGRQFLADPTERPDDACLDDLQGPTFH